MIRSIAAIFFLAAPAVAAAPFDFKVPSYIAMRASGSNQDSRTGSLQAGITFAETWQLGLGVDGGSSPGIEEDQTLKSKGGYLSIASDPFSLVSFTASAESWRLEDSVQAQGGRASVSLAVSKWVFTALAGGQQIEFRDLPQLLWASGASVVNDRSLGGTIEYFASSLVSFRLSALAHDYDQDLKQYTEGLRVLFISPEVLTTAADLYSREASLATTFNFRKVHVGLTYGNTRSALDGVRSSSWGLSGGWRISRAWSTDVGITRYRPENSEEDQEATLSAQAGVSYSW